MLTKKFYFVLGLIFILMLCGISQGGLTESSEARYAEIGREMALSNDFLHPRMLGIGHYHKPPVTYAITAMGYKLFGYSEFGARFFLAVALIIQLLLVYKMGKNKRDPKKWVPFWYLLIRPYRMGAVNVFVVAGIGFEPMTSGL